MVEMEIGNERLRLRQLGEDWIRSITAGELERLAQFCQPDVSSHLLSPRRFLQYDNVADLVAKYRQWFGACSHFTTQASRVELVGERLAIYYRFCLQEAGSWFVVEQQLYCTLQEGKVAAVQLLCSGFQGVAGEEALSAGDALLVMPTGAPGDGATCALLTPAIKAKLRELHSGQVLEIRVDDASAREDIEAWCRLSGNPLLKVSAGAGSALRFWVQKK